jgi:hypothetical protein
VNTPTITSRPITLPRIWETREEHPSVCVGYRGMPKRTAQRFAIYAQQLESPMLQELAQEALDFYAVDYDTKRYPELTILLTDTQEEYGDGSHAVKLVRSVMALFKRFTYTLPASFYWCHLSPLRRDHLFESRALRFDPREKDTARAYDAVLHAQNVFAIQRIILEATSRHGLRFEHGCDCNHILATLSPGETPYHSELSEAEELLFLDAYLWQLYANYMFFPIWPSQPRIAP